MLTSLLGPYFFYYGYRLDPSIVGGYIPHIVVMGILSRIYIHSLVQAVLSRLL